MRLHDDRRSLCSTGRLMVRSGLVLGTSGNLSVRSGDLVAVSPAGLSLGELTPADCSVLDLDGTVLEGDRPPSSETPMHLAIYRSTEAGAIVHTHSTHGAVVATTLTELPPIHYNALLLGGVVKVAEYATYGTAELAENVQKALEGGKRAALMANHGGVTLGHDLAEAYRNAQLLEWLCGVYIQAKAIGEPRILTELELLQVIERASR